MAVIIVRHPNPALGLPDKVLAHESRMVSGVNSNPVGREDNIAFSSVEEMLMHAFRTTSERQDSFTVVAWGWINAKPIDPPGFLCFEGQRFLFTPLNYGNEDYEFRDLHESAQFICHRINEDYRSDRLALEAKRQWTNVPLGRDETIGTDSIERAAKALGACVFHRHTSMEELYSLAV